MVKLVLTPGQDSDVRQAEELLDGLEPRKVVGDRGYDSQKLVDNIQDIGAEACIPPKKNAKDPRPYNKELYKKRNVVERFIGKLKQYRRVATRYEKTAVNFLGMAMFASAMIMTR